MSTFHQTRGLVPPLQPYAKLSCPCLNLEASPLSLSFHFDVELALSLIYEYDLCFATRLSIFQDRTVYILLSHCIFFRESRSFKILY